MKDAKTTPRYDPGEGAGGSARERLMDRLRRFDARFPLSVKLAVPLLTIACAGAFVMMKVIYDDEAARIRGDFESRAFLITQDVRGAIAAQDIAAAPAGPNSGLQRHIDYLVQAEPEILRIDVLDLGVNPRVVASSDHARIGGPADDAPPGREAAGGTPLTTDGTEVSGQRALESVVPFPTQGRGPMATAVYVSTASRDAHLSALLRSLFVGSGITVGAALLLLVVCVRLLVLNRVQRLLKATARLEGGDFTVRIPHVIDERSHDEMIELARHFNRTVASIEELHARLEEAATTDQLTGLANRHHLMEALEREVARAQRSGEPLAVVMADLDGLKQVNDGQGHGAGDAALRDAADAVRTAVRAGDVAARIGGDEFVAVLPGCGTDDLRAVMDRLLVTAAAGSPRATLSAGGRAAEAG